MENIINVEPEALVESEVELVKPESLVESKVESKSFDGEKYILTLGEDIYIKLGYNPTEISLKASTALRALAERKNPENINFDKLCIKALEKVSCNGKNLDSIFKINEHFKSRILTMRKVQTWALMEGLQGFLASCIADLDLEERYLKP